MSLTIGRAGLDAPLGDPGRMTVSGRTVDLAGRTMPNTAVLGAVLRDQIIGLRANADEPVVAVTSTEDPALSGWYRVLDTSATYLPVTLVYGCVDWAIKLERVPDYTCPLFESVLTAAWCTNAAGLTSSSLVARWAPPPAADLAASPATVTALGIADGTVLERVADSGLSTAAPRLWTPADPATFYAGAVTLRSGPYNPAAPADPVNPAVIGRERLHSPGVWQIDNGLVSATVAAGRLVVRWSRRTSPYRWTSANRQFTLTDPAGNSPLAGTLGAVTIVRNSPEAVTIRTTWRSAWRVASFGGTGQTVCWLDLTLRRGAQHLEASVSHPSGSTIAGSIIGPYPSAAATRPYGASSGYGHATTADPDGSRWWIGTTLAAAVSTTTGAVDGTAVATAVHPFAIGYTGSATDGATDGSFASWLSGVSERVMVVQR